jgi:hypothetical protein
MVWGLIFCAACATGAPAPRTKSTRAEESAAVALLRDGHFDEAAVAADQLLAADGNHSAAHAVRAITRFQKAAHQLNLDLRTLVAGAFGNSDVNRRYLRFAAESFDQELAAVARDLEAAAADRGFALELCPACWQVDWNQSGRIDEGDARLLQIEVDAAGARLPDGDPRRTPTFRFDRGDLYWALALVDFLRASANVALAFRFPDLYKLFGRGNPEVITVELQDRARLAGAQRLILAGLAAADRARAEYLAETDDDREWVPNPRQKNHPLPMPVDDALYRTWEGVTGDVRRLLSGEEGFDVAEVAQLGDHTWDHPPHGFIDVSKLFSQPHDLVLRPAALEHFRSQPEPVLRDLFGSGYTGAMKPTPLVKRLTRMRSEVERGEESFERKLRYLFWLN